MNEELVDIQLVKAQLQKLKDSYDSTYQSWLDSLQDLSNFLNQKFDSQEQFDNYVEQNYMILDRFVELNEKLKSIMDSANENYIFLSTPVDVSKAESVEKN